MNSQECQVISSSDDEVEMVPLELMRTMTPEPLDDTNSFEALYKYSMEKCEFCESIFHCRYDAIIHNATHIIVPLINQTTYRCLTCLYVFTSEKELYDHKLFKHNIATTPTFKCHLCRYMSTSEKDLHYHKFVKHNLATTPQALENFFKKEISVKNDTVPAPMVLQRYVGNESAVKNVDEPAPIISQRFIRNEIADKNVNVPAPIVLQNSFKKEISVNNKTVPAPMVLQNYVKIESAIKQDTVPAPIEFQRYVGNESAVKNVSDPASIIIQSFMGNDIANKNINVPAPIVLQNSFRKEISVKNQTVPAPVVLQSYVRNGSTVKKDTVPAPIGFQSYGEKKSAGKKINVPAPIVVPNFIKMEEAFQNDNVPTISENLLNTDQTVKHVGATIGLKSNMNVFTSGPDSYHHKHAKQNFAAAPKVLQSFFKHETAFNKNDNEHKVDDAKMVTKSNIKHRLVFEEDDDIFHDNEDKSDSDSNVNDLMLMDIVNDKLEESLNGVKTSEDNQQTTSEKQQTTPKPEVPQTSQVSVENPPSVHYQQLIKPGLYWCKRCTKIFPTRYSQVIHETEHMMFNKQTRSSLCKICDRHIAGNHHVLRKHIETAHPYVDLSRNRSVSVCKQCNLKFHNSLRHSTNYHAIFSCNICNQYFAKKLLPTHYEECKKGSAAPIASVKTSTVSGLQKTHYEECKKGSVAPITSVETCTESGLQKTHYEECNKGSAAPIASVETCEDSGLQKMDVVKETSEEPSEILRVCEVCASFFKDNSSFKYVCVGVNSKLQCDQICERCNNKAYIIKMIKRIRNNLKVGSQYKAKTLSNNENRLKNIQQRLKLMNQLSRR